MHTILLLVYFSGILPTILLSGYLQGRNKLAAQRDQGVQQHPYFIGGLLSPAWPVLFLVYGVWFLWRMSNQIGQDHGVTLNATIKQMRDFQAKLEGDQERILRQLVQDGAGYKEITSATIADAIQKGHVDNNDLAKRLQDAILNLQTPVDLVKRTSSDFSNQEVSDAEICDEFGRAVGHMVFDPDRAM